MRRLLALAGIGTLVAALWWRKNPSACPYSQRFFIELPHPGITRARLVEILEPRPGERVLEIGPGTGYYTFEMAGRLDGGQVDIFDIQQEMLDHVVREANKRGVTNLQLALGDAQALPYGDASFDAAVLITVLGEIPDQDRALSEIARVLKPGGRLIVGEMMVDPHIVTSGKLRERAGGAGLSFVRRLGSPLAFFARLEGAGRGASLIRRAREVDRRVLVLLRTRLRRRSIERAMAAYTRMGESGRVWIAGALVGAIVDRRRRGRWLWAALGVPLTLVVNFCVKVAVRRERPRLEGIEPAGKVPTSLSFPSAHAATSFAGATLIGSLAPPLRPALYAAAVVMAFTRPYLGVHYPSDVLAGAVVGTALGRVIAKRR